MKKWIKGLTPGVLFRRLFLSWLTGVMVAYLLLPATARSLAGLSALAEASTTILILTAAAFFAGLFAYREADVHIDKKGRSCHHERRNFCRRDL